jgi:hypothetical protein
MLSIHEIIEEAMIVDRSGSAILEELLCHNSSLLSGFNFIGLKEIVAITSWLSGGFVEDAHTVKMFLPYSGEKCLSCNCSELGQGNKAF